MGYMLDKQDVEGIKDREAIRVMSIQAYNLLRDCREKGGGKYRRCIEAAMKAVGEITSRVVRDDPYEE